MIALFRAARRIPITFETKLSTEGELLHIYHCRQCGKRGVFHRDRALTVEVAAMHVDYHNRGGQ